MEPSYSLKICFYSADCRTNNLIWIHKCGMPSMPGPPDFLVRSAVRISRARFPGPVQVRIFGPYCRYDFTVFFSKWSLNCFLLTLLDFLKTHDPINQNEKIIEFVIYFESNFMVSQNNIILYTWYLSKSLSLKIICLLHPLIRHTVFLIRIRHLLCVSHIEFL